MSNQSAYQVDLNELIFAKKNKEYGAYQLRKSYNKYVTIAAWIAIFIVLLVTTGPTIYRFINPEEVVVPKRKVVQITQLEQPPSIGEQKEIEQIEIQTTCPICNKTISELWIAKLDSVIGIRYAYICTNCKNLIKITKEKYLDTANLNQILFSQSSTA